MLARAVFWTSLLALVWTRVALSQHGDSCSHVRSAQDIVSRIESGGEDVNLCLSIEDQRYAFVFWSPHAKMSQGARVLMYSQELFASTGRINDLPAVWDM